MKSLGGIVMICAGSILLSACGQTGPLYMPGTATGVHKKDVFILGNKPESNTTAAPATSESTKPTKTDKAKSMDTDTTPDSAKTSETDATIMNSNKNSSPVSTSSDTQEAVSKTNQPDTLTTAPTN